MFQSQSLRGFLLVSAALAVAAVCAPVSAATMNFSIGCTSNAVTVVENTQTTDKCTITNMRTGSTFSVVFGAATIVNDVAVGGEAADMLGPVGVAGCASALGPKASCTVTLTIPGVDTSGVNDHSSPPGVWDYTLPVSSQSAGTNNPESPILIKVTVTDPTPEPSGAILLASGLGILALWKATRRKGFQRG